jgi:hypothetical protein
MLPRISAVVDPGVHTAIARLAAKDGVTMSQKARDLLVEALELVEDDWLDQVAAKRRTGKTISHQDLKRHLGIK